MQFIHISFCKLPFHSLLHLWWQHSKWEKSDETWFECVSSRRKHVLWHSHVIKTGDNVKWGKKKNRMFWAITYAMFCKEKKKEQVSKASFKSFLKGVVPVNWLTMMSEVKGNFMVIQVQGRLKESEEVYVNSLWDLCWGSGQQGEDRGSERRHTTKHRMKSVVLLILAFTSAVEMRKYMWNYRKKKNGQVCVSCATGGSMEKTKWVTLILPFLYLSNSHIRHCHSSGKKLNKTTFQCLFFADF